MTNKYSHYLASKAYYYAPEAEQKLYFRTLVTREINKYIIHSFASEVIEYIYNLSTDQEKKGDGFLILWKLLLTFEGSGSNQGKGAASQSQRVLREETQSCRVYFTQTRKSY